MLRKLPVVGGEGEAEGENSGWSNFAKRIPQSCHLPVNIVGLICTRTGAELR